MQASRAPIFVLCCARSGSSLLRYVLDTHPDIVAPPELHLLIAARQLSWLFEHTSCVAGSRDTEQDSQSYAKRRTRETLQAIMDEHLQRTGKAIWAEKSVSSVDFVDALDALFPDARLLYLYRQAPDVMASCAQAAQQTRGIYGFEPFVSRTPRNVVDGLADYWLDKTRRALEAEQRLGNPHIRLRYEDLVREPSVTVTRMFEFLGLATPDDMLNSVFSTEHVAGPGDSKILTTTRIHTDSIGHGARLTMNRLSPDRIRQINELHEVLGYPALEVI
jgi:protein-tyrosine sulfotransferase